MERIIKTSIMQVAKIMMLLCLFACAIPANAQEDSSRTTCQISIMEGEPLQFKIRPMLYRDLFDEDSAAVEVDFELDLQIPDSLDADVPTGIEIDQRNRILWEGGDPGMYFFRLRISRTDDADRYKMVNFFVNVMGGWEEDSTCAFIFGRVEVPNMPWGIRGEARIIDADDAEANIENPTFTTSIYRNGEFHSGVPAGNYRIYLLVDGFDAKMYGADDTNPNGTIVSLECGDRTNLDISYSAGESNIEEHFITGRVYDEVTNEGVDAFVIFKQKTPGANSYISVSTAEDGTYSIPVYSGAVTPTGFVMAMPRDSRTYNVEYYNNTENFADAEYLEINADYSGIDFPLTPIETTNANKTISGILIGEGQNAVTGTVILIKEPERHHCNFDFVRTTHTDELGNFSITGLNYGTYVAFAVPDTIFMPGYDRQGETVTWDFNRATEIVLGADSSSEYITIQFVSLQDTVFGGEGVINGKVCSSSNAESLSGVFVNVFNANNQPVGYAYSDENGEFDFSQLKEGTYMVTASIAGYEAGKSNIEINSDNMLANANITLTKVVSDNEAGVNDMFNVSSPVLYPNPVKDNATFKFNSVAGNAVITVSDIQGRILSTTYQTTIQGENSVNIDASGFDSGVYMIKA